MKTMLIAVCALLIINAACAQADHWTVKSGENINTALPADVKFHYPNFTHGIVFFRDGTMSNALLNYNLVSEEMQFIAPKGDTLALANEATTKFITIGGDTFFYDKMYMQLVSSNTVAKLAKKVTLGIGDVKKTGAYDQLSSTSSITTVKSIRLQDRITNLTERQEITLAKETSYYIGDMYNHFLPVNKKNVIKLFGKKQAALEQYFKDNRVAFSKEEDLKALVDFLKS